jgi:hypothetical protein
MNRIRCRHRHAASCSHAASWSDVASSFHAASCFLSIATIALIAIAAPLAGQTAAPPAIDSVRLLSDLHVLAHDSMQGRRAGTPGAERARSFLETSFAAIGLQRFGESWRQTFEFRGGRGSDVLRGANVVGYFRGTTDPERVIVLSAHFDHLGVREGEVFNGADDNASGTAAILALARMFAESPPRHTIVFAAFDAEESGLRGAHAFVEAPPVPRGRIAINVNLDMVGRNQAGELWVAGTHHTPALRPLMERHAQDAHVRLRIGHDRPNIASEQDWTGSSDHGPFHAAGIPFLYFGVEDHADYHRESDEADRIDAAFFTRSVQTIADIVGSLDLQLGSLLPQREH